MMNGPCRAQSTPSFITPDQFDSISQYLITKQRFCGRLITLCAAPRPAARIARLVCRVGGWRATHSLLTAHKNLFQQSWPRLDTG